jgi:hypothetical protein
MGRENADLMLSAEKNITRPNSNLFLKGTPSFQINRLVKL